MSLLARTSTTEPTEVGHHLTASDPTFTDLPWYRWWLYEQIRSQPDRLLLALPHMNREEDAGLDTHFIPLWNQVRELVLNPGPKTIDGITDALISQNIVTIKDQYEAHQSTRELVFSIIGWQTMLFKPDIPSSITGGFYIFDEMDGYHGESRVCHTQTPHASKVDLPGLLLGFGMMLPPRDYCGFDDTDDKKLFTKTKVVISKELNVHVLANVCGVKIQWVDSLSCHMELDRPSGTLFLYRYPSFCVSNLRAKETKERRKGVIHRCGFERPGSIQWATEQDVTELLEEILLSYRLLFGQSRRSRSLFRKQQPFAGIPSQGHDPFLSLICGRKKSGCPITLVEREEYDLAGDFPHLRSRIVRLMDYASSRKPRSVRQLWQDKRDSTAWLAFWSVLIFGSVAILLGVIQTVFGILQYVASMQEGKS